jgi:hypothetical protein
VWSIKIGEGRGTSTASLNQQRHRIVEGHRSVVRLQGYLISDCVRIIIKDLFTFNPYSSLSIHTLRSVDHFTDTRSHSSTMSKRFGRGGRGGQGKARGGREEQCSRALSKLLRHRAKEEGLHIYDDGYIVLEHVV